VPSTISVLPTVEPEQPQPPAGDPLLAAWQRSGGIAGICEQMTLAASGAFTLQGCYAGAMPSNGQLPGELVAPLVEAAAQVAAFEWELPQAERYPDAFVDRFFFYGQGVQAPSAEQIESIRSLLTQAFEAARRILLSAAPTPAPGGDSGIEGQAVLGPACAGPVRIDTPCPDLPYEGLFLVLDASGQERTRFHTDAEGRFRVALPPGTYLLRLSAEQSLPSMPDLEVKVLAGQFTALLLQLDSGIR
jgi:hypothetical protein